jgi:hypothetical protein
VIIYSAMLCAINKRLDAVASQSFIPRVAQGQ